jgi:hypothetical protein
LLAKGIGNGTSMIIFEYCGYFNDKNLLINQSLMVFFVEIFLCVLMILICISQTARINIDVVSARQLAF